MRIIVAALAGLMLTGAAQEVEAPAQAELQPFTFKQFRTDLTEDAARASGIVVNCGQGRLGVKPIQHCRAGDAFDGDGFSGLEMFGTVILFEDNQASFFDFAFERSGWSTAEKALTDRYGIPCERESKTLQNAFGAQYPQEEIVWCFSDGKLTLSTIAREQRDRAGLQFVADRLAPPPPPPTVNF